MADEREDKIVYVIQFVIPAEAGIQEKQRNWIPHQVRNDKKGNPVARLQGISS
jgi:hypothetical protein